MLDKLAGIAARYEELEKMMADPEIAIDYAKVAEYAKERSNLEDIVKKYRVYKSVVEQIAEARELINEGDHELKEMAYEEINELEPQQAVLEDQLKVMLLPRDPRDKKNVIMEIRAGAGGDEAALFADDLYRMYTRFAENQRWKIELMSQNKTGGGGVKEVSFLVKGRGAYSRLKFESGVHRVQRVPATESQGRIHTSTATVAVLAEVEAVEIEINQKDIDVESYRAGGAGGQHVQKNDTAIRVTHIPSGVVVQCQDERSKTQNLERAMSILRARLYDMEERRRQQEQADTRKSMVGSGDRSEKIRTYNYPQSRVTDHRVNYSSHNLPTIMDGAIDEFIDELATQDEADRLQSAGI